MSLTPRSHRLSLVASTVLSLSLAASACGDDDEPSMAPDTGAPPADGASPDAGPTDDAGPTIGTVEDLVELETNTEGLAFGDDGEGNPVLYVGLLRGNEVVSVAPDGTVAHVADVPAPLGMAARPDGQLVVCGRVDETMGSAGAIWLVNPTDGSADIIVDEAPAPLETANFVAIAPDGSLLFSDSAANVVYRADADGGPATLVTDAFTYPNGIAFEPDGTGVIVSSWDTGILYRMSFDAGTYGSPEPVLEDVINTDGLAFADDGSLVLITNPEGILVSRDFAAPTQIAEPSNFGLPANGAFGHGPYGEGWLYVTNLLGRPIHRVFLGTGSP